MVYDAVLKDPDAFDFSISSLTPLKYTSPIINTGFVDDVNDTSATNDDTGEFWTVDSHMTHSAYVQYTFDEDTDSPTRIRVGARNIFDEDPPLADESFGYMGSLHSSRGRFVYLSARKEF